MVAFSELQTENATMGSTVPNDLLLAMPNLNRDASSLLTLQPATAPYAPRGGDVYGGQVAGSLRSEEHTSELQSQSNLVCRLLLEKKKKNNVTFRWLRADIYMRPVACVLGAY